MSATESIDDTVSTQCGHETSPEEVVSVPGVGPLCRECHTPIPLNRWGSVIDTSTVNHQTGESSNYSTWLLGLDEVGRGVYFDQRSTKVVVLVPKYHRGFQADVEGDEKPFRKHPPKFGGSGEIVNAPDNGVLIVYDQISFRPGTTSKRRLSEWVSEKASDDGWNALSETALEMIEDSADYYDKSCYDDGVFPVGEARELVEKFRDK